MNEPDWRCVCGETDIAKHDIGMVIAHEYEISEEEGRDILIRMRTRLLIGDDRDDEIVNE